MQEVLLDKVVVNMGVGSDPDEMKKAVQIIKLVTGKKPTQTTCKVRIPDWGLRPGIPTGIKVTLRKNDAVNFLKNAIQAKEGKISSKSFDKEGNFGFGVREYIDLPGAKYDPKLGIKGFDVVVALKKKGFRVKTRRIMQSRVGKKQRVSKEEAIKFAESMGIKVE